MDKRYPTLLSPESSMSASSKQRAPSNHSSVDRTISTSTCRRPEAVENPLKASGSDLSSRLSSTMSFPTQLHHRQGSETRPNNHATRNGQPEERQHWPRRLFIETSDLDSDKSRNRQHKHSKSRDHRIPRTMNQIASAGGSARNLLPSRSFKGHEKDQDGDRLLKPTRTHESSKSPLSSRSTSAHNTSRNASLTVDETNDLDSPLSLLRRKEIKTMDDLEKERRKREAGEASLRSTLSSIGSVATDITRQLDYTYYNLLERVSTLHSTIHSFQELADSSASLHTDFSRDTSNMEHDIRRQLEEFQGFHPQIRKIDALEKRMNAGRDKVQALGDRLDAVRKEIDGWERREGEWQARVSRRLRILWAVMGTAMVVLVIAYVVQTWPVVAPSSSGTDVPSRMEMLAGHQSVNAVDASQESFDPNNIPFLLEHMVNEQEEDDGGVFPSILKSSLLSKTTTGEESESRTPSSDEYQTTATDTEDAPERREDPFQRLFDEL